MVQEFRAQSKESLDLRSTRLSRPLYTRLAIGPIFRSYREMTRQHLRFWRKAVME